MKYKIFHSLSFSPLKGGWGILLCVLLLASCGSKKHASSSSAVLPDGTEGGLSPLQNIVQTVNANRQDETFATAKISFSAQSGEKSISMGGTLRMKRDDVIQISLVTFGILEVVRLEVTPDYFMAINKVERQYLKASFQDVPFLKTAGVDFHTLQALFWDELFLLNSSSAAPTDKQFTKSMEGGGKAKLVNSDSRLAVLTFLVGLPGGLIQQTSVSPRSQGASPYVTWEYAEFGSLGKKSFPTKHNITIANGSKPINATLSLSNLRNDSGWETRTEIPRRYTEVTVEKLLARLMSM